MQSQHITVNVVQRVGSHTCVDNELKHGNA